jgi:hypothetical protein
MESDFFLADTALTHQKTAGTIRLFSISGISIVTAYEMGTVRVYPKHGAG